MRHSLLYLIYLVLFKPTFICAQVGVQQYVYVKNNEVMKFVPLLTFEASSHTYVEARYNYEESNTFSLYLGRNFARGDKVAYSFTPILGAVVGRFKGGSAGLNSTVEYNKIFFSLQSQYTVSFRESNPHFVFAWSDLSYHPRKWCYVGLSTQQTLLPQKKTLNSEFGISLGFIVGKWTFPFYCFSPASDHAYLVLGINYGSLLKAFKNK